MKSKYVVVDVESDGNLLGVNSMVCFGAVIVEKGLKRTFYGQTKPISDKYNAEALGISGFSREEHEKFEDPKIVFEKFSLWLKNEVGEKPILISDNNGYDASWINWYMLTFCNKNPFGWSSRRIGDIFCGWYNNMYYKWKIHRDSVNYPHNHDPLSDAKGNASALLYLENQGFNLFK